MSRSVRNCIKTKAMVLESTRVSLKEARRVVLLESLLSSRNSITYDFSRRDVLLKARENHVARCIENVDRRIKMNFGPEFFIV